ncbi:hypothetical protein QR680_007125 [Steinernema hermaphroditum]|uniref:G-protein coupled receptors family 1 profile domain-containing protein n=1 Tax=Steinernema hermaphroditum TaxID=289476 RepID=A0AA39HYY4_9BILA|nr:hypothetical protein QR680_007125 [Steinernema hermaphroditum]
MDTKIGHITNPSFAIVTVMLTSCIGLLINTYVIQAVIRTRLFGESFSRICISQCLANVGLNVMFFCFIGPLAVINTNLLKSYMGGRPGQLLNFFWYSCVMTHLLSSINRLICLSFPLKYKEIFTKERTTIALVVIWIFAFVLICPQFYNNCLMVFIESDFSFDFRDTECGQIQATYVDFTFSMSMISMIILIDIATSARIYWIKKGMYSKVTQRQIKFFVQTCTEEVVLMLCVLCFYKVSQYFNGHWLKFICTTWIWIFAHTADGCIILLFNRELRCRALLKILPAVHKVKMRVFVVKNHAVLGTGSYPI